MFAEKKPFHNKYCVVKENYGRALLVIDKSSIWAEVTGEFQSLILLVTCDNNIDSCN